MSNVFQNIQLQRIADGIQGGGSSVTINMDVTGFGDMQGATSSAAGVHGLVPAPSAGDEGKVLTGTGTWEEMAGGEVDYSTTEQNTGQKWIDGKDIYQKTIDFGAMPVDSEKDVAHGITNIGMVIYMEFIVYNATENQWRLMPGISRGNAAAQSVCGVDSQYVFVLGGQFADINGDWTGTVTLRYTKQ